MLNFRVKNKYTNEVFDVVSYEACGKHEDCPLAKKTTFAANTDVCEGYMMTLRSYFITKCDCQYKYKIYRVFSSTETVIVKPELSFYNRKTYTQKHDTPTTEPICQNDTTEHDYEEFATICY